MFLTKGIDLSQRPNKMGNRAVYNPHLRKAMNDSQQSMYLVQPVLQQYDQEINAQFGRLNYHGYSSVVVPMVAVISVC